MNLAPIKYLLENDEREYLAFRTENVDGRLLLMLVPDSDDQHPLDVVSIFSDEERLSIIPWDEPVAKAGPLTDAEALDELNLMLSASEWPGASGMEDVYAIVRRTGRTEVPNAPSWERH